MNKFTSSVGLSLKHWGGLTLLTLCLTAVMVKAGFWQLSRSEQKKQWLEEMSQVQSAPPIPLTEALSSIRYVESVSLQGRFLTQFALLLDNQRHQGQIEVESTAVPGEGAAFTVWLPGMNAAYK